VLPLLMFVFSMALGEDYNILIIGRIHEETRRQQSFVAAVTHAIGITGGTITSAGIILAGTFAVLGIAGGSSEAQQLGYSIVFGVLLDTFFVRSVLIPSIAMLLGPLNWWPSTPPRVAAPATSKHPAIRRVPPGHPIQCQQPTRRRPQAPRWPSLESPPRPARQHAARAHPPPNASTKTPSSCWPRSSTSRRCSVTAS
jgi:hypothetical protein